MGLSQQRTFNYRTLLDGFGNIVEADSNPRIRLDLAVSPADEIILPSVRTLDETQEEDDLVVALAKKCLPIVQGLTSSYVIKLQSEPHQGSKGIQVKVRDAIEDKQLPWSKLKKAAKDDKADPTLRTLGIACQELIKLIQITIPDHTAKLRIEAAPLTRLDTIEIGAFREQDIIEKCDYQPLTPRIIPIVLSLADLSEVSKLALWIKKRASSGSMLARQSSKLLVFAKNGIRQLGKTKLEQRTMPLEMKPLVILSNTIPGYLRFLKRMSADKESSADRQAKLKALGEKIDKALSPKI